MKLQQYEQDFEKIINDMKKDFKAKEKSNNKIIEKLKNEIKIKDHILNSFQETIIVKNQMIERFKVQLKKKDNQINELKRKIRKNLEINYSNSNIFFKRKSSNSSYKENKIKNNSSKNRQKETSKEKVKNENKSSNNLLQLQHYHSNTNRENNTNIFRTNLAKKFKNNSYSDKVRDNSARLNEESMINHNLKNLKYIFLLQEKNSEDAFLKRYSNSNKNKYLKQNIKNQNTDSTYSFMYHESGNEKKIYKIDIPKFKK